MQMIKKKMKWRPSGLKNYNLKGVVDFSFCRAEAKQWFSTKVEELSGMKLPEKLVKRTILSAIRYRFH